MRIIVSALIYLALAHGALAQDDMDGQVAAALDEIFGAHGLYDTAVLDPDTGALHIENAILADGQSGHVSIGEIVFADPIITDGHLTHFSGLTLVDLRASQPEHQMAINFDLLTVTGTDFTLAEWIDAFHTPVRPEWIYTFSSVVMSNDITHLHMENFNHHLAQTNTHIDALTLDGLIVSLEDSDTPPETAAFYFGIPYVAGLEHMRVSNLRYKQDRQYIGGYATPGIEIYSIEEITFTDYQNGELGAFALSGYNRDLSYIETIGFDENTHIETLTITNLDLANTTSTIFWGFTGVELNAGALTLFDTLEIGGYARSTLDYNLSLGYGYLTGLIEQPDGTYHSNGSAEDFHLTDGPYGMFGNLIPQPYRVFIRNGLDADFYLDLRYDPVAETLLIATDLTTQSLGDLQWTADLAFVPEEFFFRPFDVMANASPHLAHFEISYADNGFLDMLFPLITGHLGMSRDALIDDWAQSQAFSDPDRFAPIVEEVTGFLRQGGALTITLALGTPVSLDWLNHTPGELGIAVTATYTP